MTDDWWAAIYEKAGRDLTDAHIQRLANEFRYLGAKFCAEAEQTTTQANSPSSRNETA